MGSDQKIDVNKVEQLSWLMDAPLFIDEQQIASFFDAVLRPEFEIESYSLEKSNETTKDLRGNIELGGKAKLPSYLKWLVSLEGEAKVSTDAGIERKTGGSTETKLRVLSSAERKLQNLISYYLESHQGSLVFNDGPLGDRLGAGKHWFDYEERVPSRQPRPLAFFDLSPRTKVIPTAAEFDNGHIVLLFVNVMKGFTNSSGGPLEKYPDDPVKNDQELRAERKKYWASFANHYDPRVAMEVVEAAASTNGRIRWIDYRLPLTDEGDTLHLHICPASKYDAGVFGYNFIKRGYKHGLRIVGTLKSEPDMNVLAIYER
jgi:hypothetical protein